LVAARLLQFPIELLVLKVIDSGLDYLKLDHLVLIRDRNGDRLVEMSFNLSLNFI
jgi:hypothetical protein